MRVAHLTYSTNGGAGTACRRLHAALRLAGADSSVHAAAGPADLSGGVHVRPGGARWRARLDRWRLWRYPRRRFFAWWSDNRFPTRTLAPLLAARPDVLHLHWVGDALLSLAEVERVRGPLVWTMHDAWPFTGGCHYAGDCGRFATGCGRCPQLGSGRPADLSSANLARKRAVWAAAHIVWVSPSRWLAAEAKRSWALAGQRVEVIPNGLDPSVFAPADRAQARAELGLTDDDLAILTGAAGDISDRRKGLALLVEALAGLAPEIARRVVVLVFGGGSLPLGAVRVRSLGRIEGDASLVRAYSAADAFVLPSLQDNLPNTALESIACGCPVLAFDLGGLNEIVVSGENGLLATPATGTSLGAILSQFGALSRDGREAMRAAARGVFLARFRADACARAHLTLYAELAGHRA